MVAIFRIVSLDCHCQKQVTILSTEKTFICKLSVLTTSPVLQVKGPAFPIPSLSIFGTLKFPLLELGGVHFFCLFVFQTLLSIAENAKICHGNCHRLNFPIEEGNQIPAFNNSWPNNLRCPGGEAVIAGPVSPSPS